MIRLFDECFNIATSGDYNFEKTHFASFPGLGTILGRFSIIYFRGLRLRIRVRVWVVVRVRVRVRVWVRVRVGVRVRVSVVL